MRYLEAGIILQLELLCVHTRYQDSGGAQRGGQHGTLRQDGRRGH